MDLIRRDTCWASPGSVDSSITPTSEVTDAQQNRSIAKNRKSEATDNRKSGATDNRFVANSGKSGATDNRFMANSGPTDNRLIANNRNNEATDNRFMANNGKREATNPTSSFPEPFPTGTYNYVRSHSTGSLPNGEGGGGVGLGRSGGNEPREHKLGNVRKSVVTRITANPQTMAFLEWVESIPQGWVRLHQRFLKEGSYLDTRSAHGLNGMNKGRWIKVLDEMGFSKVVAAAEVFEQILSGQQAVDDDGRSYRKKLSPELLELADIPVEAEITLAQFKRFEKQAVAVSLTMGQDSEQSPANRFCKFLKKRRGSCLRAWRLDLDVRGTGRVAHADFVNACRTLGIGDQSKTIWRSMDLSRNQPLEPLEPMEFKDLAPEEGKALEEFAGVLWQAVGCDFSKAWAQLDKNKQNYVTLQEFRDGAEANWQFVQGADLLFKGLDTTGLGRLKKADFEYISKCSSTARGQLGIYEKVNCSALQDLFCWVQAIGGVDEFLRRLDPKREIRNDKLISVGDLAARLTALGFEGDALLAAHRSARDFQGSRVGRNDFGGTHTTKESLHRVLTGNRARERVRPQTARAATGNELLRPALSGSTPRWNAEKSSCDWDSKVYNLSESNSKQCKYKKTCFPYVVPVHQDPTTPVDQDPWLSKSSLIEDPKSSLDRSTQSFPGSPHSRSDSFVMSGRSPTMWQQEPWDSNFGHIVQESNSLMTSHSRTYFKNCDRKPVRDEILSKVSTKRAPIEHY